MNKVNRGWFIWKLCRGRKTWHLTRPHTQTRRALLYQISSPLHSCIYGRAKCHVLDAQQRYQIKPLLKSNRNLLNKTASAKIMIITKSLPPDKTYFASVIISHRAPSKNGGHRHREEIRENGLSSMQVPPLRHLLVPKQSGSTLQFFPSIVFIRPAGHLLKKI